MFVVLLKQHQLFFTQKKKSKNVRQQLKKCPTFWRKLDGRLNPVMTDVHKGQQPQPVLFFLPQ